MNIAVISHARHSSSFWFKLFIRFCPTYIQLPLSINIPFYIDTTLHLLSYPLYSSLGFITPALILPPIDCGPTPTVGQPFPGNGGINSGQQGVSVFPPLSDSSGNSLSPSLSPSSAGPSSNLHAAQNLMEDDEKDNERHEHSTLRLSALEFMISLSVRTTTLFDFCKFR